MTSLSTNSKTEAKPFLRWAGGKRWFAKYLRELYQVEINNYYEPFLGGGAVFFNINNYQSAEISDLNGDLVNTYQCIKDNPEKIIAILSSFTNTEQNYYEVRKTFFKDKFEQAAKFIYLNKTSFNGIYRVNRNGVFNVPYGFRKDINIVDGDNLINVSRKLQNVQILQQDFYQIESKVQKSDLIFLDPPYTVAHENNGFIAYNQRLFSLDDQKRLALLIEKIIDVGAYYILTNAKHDKIKEIYKSIDDPVVLSRSSVVGGKGAKRNIYNEYIFSNILFK